MKKYTALTSKGIHFLLPQGSICDDLVHCLCDGEETTLPSQT